MNIKDAKSLLRNNNFRINSESRLSNSTGWQLRLESGQCVNVYDKGTIFVQGRDPSPVQALFARAPSALEVSARNESGPRAFVVYGHDEGSRIELEDLLTRWGCEPLTLDQLPSEGMTFTEKIEHYGHDVTFAVVLATPDDEGYPAGRSSEKKYRTKQNVVLQLGMLLALLGRSKVAILIKDQHRMERPSDIPGLIYIPYIYHVSETAMQLAKEMNAQGFNVDASTYTAAIL
jgi:predicted nucleotide-binding protein